MADSSTQNANSNPQTLRVPDCSPPVEGTPSVNTGEVWCQDPSSGVDQADQGTSIPVDKSRQAHPCEIREGTAEPREHTQMGIPIEDHTGLNSDEGNNVKSSGDTKNGNVHDDLCDNENTEIDVADTETLLLRD